MSDPNEVDVIDDENLTQPDPQPDPNGGVSPNGVPYPPQAPGIGEVLKW